MSVAENQSYYNGQSEEREIRLKANESFKKNIYIYTNCLKRGKTRTGKSRVVVVLYLIGEREWREFSGPITEQRKGKANQSRNTFDTQWKFLYSCCLVIIQCF